MITQTLQLNLVPKGVWPRLYVSQYDAGSRTLTFEIYNGDQRFTLTSGTTAKIQGTKPDRHGFSYDAEVDTPNNVITADITQQMTAAHGEANCELVLFKSGQRIGTLNFVMMIQQAGLNDETDTSDSDLPDIIAEATEQMLTAEAYAKGTRNGTAVTSGQTGYHDNSKYYKEQAATQASNASTSATSANTNALKAEGYAVGKQNGTTQTSGTYYHNNAQYYKEQAAGSATTASTKAGEASTSANTASQKASAASTSAQTASDKALVAEGYAKGTQNGTPVGSTSPYYHNNAEYFKDLANPTVAANVSFNNSGTDMSSTNVQDGIVENRTSIQNLSTVISKNGAKNLLPVPYYDSGLSAITGTTVACADNGDGTVTFNGTNSTAGAKAYNYELGTQNLKNLRNKSVTLAVEDMPPVADAQVLVDIYDDTPTRLVRYTLDASTPNMTITMPATANTYAFQFQVKAGRTVTNATPKPMLCLAEDYALNPSWQPPAKTNRQLTKETTALIENQNVNGSKNICPFEGTVSKTISDTAAGMIFYLDLKEGDKITYICNQDNAMTSNTRNSLQVTLNTDSNVAFRESTDTNYHLQSGLHVLQFTVPTTGRYNFSIWAHTLSTVTTYSKFMVCDTDFYNVDPSYQPYAKSNRKLTEDVANIEATIVQKVNPNASGTVYDISFSNASYPRALVVSNYTYGTLAYWSNALHYIPIAKNNSMTSVTASNESSNGIRLTFSSGDIPTLIPLNTDASIWTITKVS